MRNDLNNDLIVGCGYVGRRIARLLVERGDQVTALVRSEASRSALAESAIPAQITDLDSPPLSPIPLANARVYYLAPPPTSGTADPRMKAFLETCEKQGHPRRILYFSATGVYGDCAGEWVDEDRPVNPSADRSLRRLDAEKQLGDWAKRTGNERIILRVAGIYGPGRLPLERLRQRLPLVRETEAPFTNRVHVYDLVAASLTAMEKAPAGALYNLSDGHPSTMNDYFNRLADLAGLPRPPVIKMAEAESALSPGMLSYMKESRRLSNKRLLDELGVKLKYPTLDQGLPACFEGQKRR